MNNNYSKNIDILYMDRTENNQHIYDLVKIKMPKISSHVRNKILDQIMEKEKLIMIIELWDKGGIISRPREEVYYIFVKKRASSKNNPSK